MINLDGKICNDIIENMDLAFAYCKVVLDDSGKIIDYEFIKVNKAFEKLTEKLRGIKYKSIIGKKSTEIYPSFLDEDFDWINFYGDIALNCKKDSFIKYFESSNCLYKINVISSEKYYFTALFCDVSSELLEDTQKLKEREERLKQITENMGEVFWLRSADNKHMLYISPAYEKIWGRTRESLYKNPSSFIESVHPEDMATVINEFSKYTEKGDAYPFNYEYRILQPNGNIRWIWARSFPVKDEAGNVIRHTGIAVDITDRKLAENKIKKALDEKDILLAEIHHRVKNNLQIIISLLDLQEIYSEDNALNAKFKDLRNRIMAMTMVHERLYKTSSFDNIDLGTQLVELTNTLIASYSFFEQDISCDFEIDNIDMDIDRSISCSLIVNELVSNAIKHGFKGLKSGKIIVKLLKKDDNILLSVKDDGKGAPKDFNFNSCESLGMQLVASLTTELSGNLSIKKDEGMEFSILFPYE